MITCKVEIQRMIESAYAPSNAELQLWVESALIDYQRNAEILIRIVDRQEMVDLNTKYRHKSGATNILSFPFTMPEGIKKLDLLGDLVVCDEIIQHEAVAQKKAIKDHWAHIVIHGTLHLIGYDHINDSDASRMEKKEINVLQQLYIENPYLENEIDG